MTRSLGSNYFIDLIFQDSGASKKASLDDLSKEELVSKCKNLLKLAQHAKSAKDGRCPCLFMCWWAMTILGRYITVLDLLLTDLKKLLEEKETENAKSSAEIDILKGQVEDNEDVIKVKQR